MVKEIPERITDFVEQMLPPETPEERILEVRDRCREAVGLPQGGHVSTLSWQQIDAMLRVITPVQRDALGKKR